MGLLGISELGQNAQSDGDINELRAVRYFIVAYDVPTDVLIATNEAAIPDYFDPHPSDSTYLVKNIRGQAHDADQAGRYFWKIQVDYSNRIIGPLSLPTQYEWDFSEASEPYFFDLSSTPKQVVNSAGDPFDNLPERDGGAITLTVTKNVATSFSTAAALSNKNFVNSDSFTVDGASLTARQAKFSGIQISGINLQNGTYFRTVKTVVKFRKTWDDVFADMGYRQLVSGKLIPIVQANVAVDKPYPLNGSGVAQAVGTAAAQLTFQPYQTVAFSGSPLL